MPDSDSVYVSPTAGKRRYHEDDDCRQIKAETAHPRRREIVEAWGYPPCRVCAADD